MESGVGTGIWYFGTLYSCGIGILFKQNLDVNIKNIYRDTDGRLLRVEVNVFNQNFRSINIYAPCDDPQARKAFISALDQHLFCSSYKILAGNFNFTMDNRYKAGSNLARCSRRRRRNV
jgi:hypothetical protein